MLKRMQRHAPSWLEQLPQLPDTLLDNLQHARDAERRYLQEKQRLEQITARNLGQQRQRRRRALAAVACLAGAALALPGGLQQFSEAPLLSWLLAGAALVLLWPTAGDS
jgi:ubiquinone biosynthesis protein